ncbi:MauE/DoxX family redox-associated membrane protein [Flavobacterium psychrophilum]|uniref:MauE/DoxX family redox-associated membrane protein n=1 Tax=Flavobacterium psychrophilum TaxID=96345 RepID=UPI00090A7897|nr:MauE/DoxX family redox-associated membrane protein [Flavobacterium psychrophilum]EKT2072637.1 hypothetical protein [Flavobacterium psychrophilum]EKT4492150.1 hypothetical protein [Flavobacterium psychrophilum]SHH92623.1 Probable transmembrane protein of unknown function [Flavobacterium psychrophilum]
MRLNARLQSVLLETICLLYILLFVYAAVSKLLDFENFQVQLGQSPLLSPYAPIVVYSIPLIEILISLFLMVPKYRFIGLLSAFGLMLMFSVYIVIILNYSSFIPCSCGGILSEMSWTEHLVFNISFVVLALIGIVLQNKGTLNLFKFYIPVILIGFLSSLLVVVLFLLSEEEIHRNNSFLRRYPHHPITSLKGIPIQFNSYYIAGFSKDKIYLGNSTAPLHMLSVDTSLTNQTTVRIEIVDSKNYTFFSVKVIVSDSLFYMSDGNVPIIYKGTTGLWKAKTFLKGKTNFSLIEPIAKNDFVIRGNNAKNGEHVLGVLKKSNNSQASFYPNVLQKKIDGVFDTDGMLLYNEALKKVVYVYYYRNSFVVANSDFTKVYNEKTIDTVSQVSMEFAYLKSNSEKKFAKQPPMIQKYATTSGKYLFVKSDRLGKYESEVMLTQASIIDVYDLEKQTYEFSFYLYHYKNEEVKLFKIYGSQLFGLTKNYLITCKLKTNYFKRN